MRHNADYGKLESGLVTYAPKWLRDGNALMTAPTAAQYLAAGWKALHLGEPATPAPTGYHYEADGFAETDTDITRQWKTVADTVAAKRYNVADLFFWLRGYDADHADAPKGQAVKDWLDANDLYTIAVTTREVADDNTLFGETLAGLQLAVGFTDAEIAEALTYAEM